MRHLSHVTLFEFETKSVIKSANTGKTYRHSD